LLDLIPRASTQKPLALSIRERQTSTVLPDVLLIRKLNRGINSLPKGTWLVNGNQELESNLLNSKAEYFTNSATMSTIPIT
jgi:hypothetical protein